MITLLSPTKTQANITVNSDSILIESLEIQKAYFLMSLLNKLSTSELSMIMKISDSLAVNTKKLIDDWSINTNGVTQAIHLFQGDAFQKLDALSFSQDDILFSQDHLIVLSALYGYLRPLDSVSAYRLDMKDLLKIPGYGNLYNYWKETVTIGLNNLLLKQKNNIVLNLASSEYFNVIDIKKLSGKIIYVDFKVQKNNCYKTVGIYAKRGRGLLARYIIQNKIDMPDEIMEFNAEGFQFSDALSTPNHYVFTLNSEKLNT